MEARRSSGMNSAREWLSISSTVRPMVSAPWALMESRLPLRSWVQTMPREPSTSWR